MNPLIPYKDRHRLLIVFAPDAENAAFREQIADIEAHSRDFAERDLVLFTVLEKGISKAGTKSLSSAEKEFLRERFGVIPGQFRVLLIGKDGGAKRTDMHPVSMQTLNGVIDAMPMRRDEMRKRGQKTE